MYRFIELGLLPFLPVQMNDCINDDDFNDSDIDCDYKNTDGDYH